MLANTLSKQFYNMRVGNLSRVFTDAESFEICLQCNDNLSIFDETPYESTIFVYLFTLYICNWKFYTCATGQVGGWVDLVHQQIERHCYGDNDWVIGVKNGGVY